MLEPVNPLTTDTPSFWAARAVRVSLGGAVAALLQRPGDVEVVAPAGELQALVAKLASLTGQIFQRQVCPLAGEQRDGTGHVTNSVAKGGRKLNP